MPVIHLFKRHPQLPVREVLLTAARANCCPKEVGSAWFQVYHAKLQVFEIDNFSQIINLDETGINSSLQTKILAQKGQRDVHQLQGRRASF